MQRHTLSFVNIPDKVMAIYRFPAGATSGYQSRNYMSVDQVLTPVAGYGVPVEPRYR